jgi:phosphatidylserine/phosphatidylglycerophosphate/cardiolipin synthase-like enzyme
MKTFRSIVLALVLGSTGLAQDPIQNPIFFSSVLRGVVGDTPVKLCLAPSPHIEQAVVEFIQAASNTIDVCVYEINLEKVLVEIERAIARGVKVRLAMPKESLPGKDNEKARGIGNRLLKQKVLKVTNNRSGLMHNKFMVADGHWVWTGSYNFTRNDTEWNDNNAITFSHQKLAENYLAEFEEIWAEQHGKRNSTPTPHPRILMGDVLVQNYFSPEDDLESAIVGEILKATNSVYIMAFAFTDRAMFDALTERMRAGVKVYVLLDLTLSRHGSSLRNELRAAGATVRISSNNGRMHHKVMVIDENVVITGSANFSAAALKSNDENIVIFSSPPLARAFTAEFTRCWRAQPYWVNKWSQPGGR